jgi:hypothetical protein
MNAGSKKNKRGRKVERGRSEMVTGRKRWILEAEKAGLMQALVGRTRMNT